MFGVQTLRPLSPHSSHDGAVTDTDPVVAEYTHDMTQCPVWASRHIVTFVTRDAGMCAVMWVVAGTQATGSLAGHVRCTDKFVQCISITKPGQ